MKNLWYNYQVMDLLPEYFGIKTMADKKIKRGKGFYSISAVSKMFSVHQQTIRLYEKEGLINPKRSDGNTRMFSEEDIEKLEEIIHLTHQLGINLAGVEMILQLHKKIKRMQTDMNKLFNKTQEELSQEANNRKTLIQNYSSQLNEKKQTTPNNNLKKTASTSDNPSFKDWDIDYEE
jgi:MerR family transcriptional regulator/heat shock protein HspR